MTPVAWRKPTRTLLADGTLEQDWAIAAHPDILPHVLAKLGWEPLYLRHDIPDEHIRRVAKLHGLRATPKLMAFARGVMA